MLASVRLIVSVCCRGPLGKELLTGLARDDLVLGDDLCRRLLDMLKALGIDPVKDLVPL